MQVKLKVCCKCEQERVIYKNHQGQKYCKYCWSKFNPTIIKQKSTKRIKQDKEYSKVRKDFLSQPKNAYCQAKLPGCTIIATDIHHKYSGSDRSEHYLDDNTYLPICRNCHSVLHDKLSAEDCYNLGFKL